MTDPPCARSAGVTAAALPPADIRTHRGRLGRGQLGLKLRDGHAAGIHRLHRARLGSRRGLLLRARVTARESLSLIWHWLMRFGRYKRLHVCSVLFALRQLAIARRGSRFPASHCLRLFMPQHHTSACVDA